MLGSVFKASIFQSGNSFGRMSTAPKTSLKVVKMSIDVVAVLDRARG
jgi:hypothetical protein